jgi:hypothetical protein
MNLNINIVARAVQEARKEAQDRVLVTMSGFTYGFWHPELVKFQRTDGHVEFLVDTRIPSGSVEVENIERDNERKKQRKMIDCRETI